MTVPSQPAFDDLELLAQVARLWTQADLDYVLREVVRLATKSVGAMRASLFLSHNEELRLTNFILERDVFLPPESEAIIQAVAREGLAGWVLQHQQGTIVDNTSTDKRWYHVPEQGNEPRSAISVPFSYEAELFGVITLVHEQPGFFNERHLRLMEIITSQVALAVHNAQVYRQTRAQREQLTAILHAIPDILMVLDNRARVMLVSNAIGSILTGHSPQSIEGIPLAALAGQDTLFETLSRAIGEIPEDRTDWSFEARSEQTNRDYLVHILSRRRAPSNEPGYIIVMNEVTALRNLSRFKDNILRIVSHDLRTPLVVITGYADLLMDDTSRYPEMQQYVAGILQASERMDIMLNNMLRVERLRNTPSELHETVNLKALVAIVLRDLRPLATHKNIRLDMQFNDSEVPAVQGDIMLLQQAMENFISNAIKYTDDGGQVMVSTYCDQERFHFVVEDNGSGISADELPFVFQKYYRGNKTETHPDGGIGLGLSLVKNVISQHGGDVWVESQPDRGSRFGFWLPLK
ncbi:MAG TPA: ATP-binding protein [Phototrophicaceae bacterium]|jgi:signal transduction histidine kinase|nr:ATP-binding protein [Phototrophicaceae bacterium]